MEYTVILRDARDFTCEADYCKPNTLQDDKKFAIWFDDLEKAKDACVKAGGYCVEDKDFEEVWTNPVYIKERERKMQRILGARLLPKEGDYER